MRCKNIKLIVNSLINSKSVNLHAEIKMMKQVKRYIPKNKVRIVTAASLFDGHDAAINIMRRIIQATGCEVIHLGHDRSVEEVVNCAIEEDANAIAMTSYQGGHTEYLKFMHDLLQKNKATHIKIFAGGGGTILPEEIKELEAYGITRIYHPDDGREMGLQGMINDLIKKSDFLIGKKLDGGISDIKDKNVNAIARMISAAENCPDKHTKILSEIKELSSKSVVFFIDILCQLKSYFSSINFVKFHQTIVESSSSNVLIYNIVSPFDFARSTSLLNLNSSNM